MKTKYFLLNKIQHITFVLVLIATLITSTSASAEGRALDPTFGTNGIVVTDLGGPTDIGTSIALQPDGKIVMSGLAQLDEDNPYYKTPVIVRYNSDGTLDTTFGTGGKLTVDTGRYTKVALQTDGKLILGGSAHGSLALTRYTTNGTLDTTFGINGITTAGETENGSIQFGDLVIQSDGKIVVVGTWETYGNHYPAVIARFHENGTLDENFGVKYPDFPDYLQHSVQGVALQSNGKIIMSGSMLSERGDTGNMTLGRFTNDTNPWLDPTFGTNGTVVMPLDNFGHGPSALAIQADDKIVIAGRIYGYDETNDDLVLARYSSSGIPDTTFAGSGLVITDLGQDEIGNDLAIQRDGKIIVAGESHNESDGSSDLLLVRYNSDGSPDTTFGEAGKVISDLGGNSTSVLGMALQPDGKILAFGTKDGDAVLARYTESLPPPPTTVTFKSKAASDGLILESTETSNKGGTLNKTATTFYVGDDAKDKQYRAIISFNTASLPDNAIIVSAQVKIKRQGVVGTDPFNTHKSLFLEIRNGLFSNDLDLKLSDFAAAPSSTTPETVTPLTSSWYAASLSSSNLPFVNKYGVTQFRLRFDRDDNDDMGADYMKFFTGESTTAYQPELIVTYILP